MDGQEQKVIRIDEQPIDKRVDYLKLQDNQTPEFCLETTILDSQFS